MTPEVPPLRTLPDAVQQTLHDFEQSFSLHFRIFLADAPDGPSDLYTSPGLLSEGGATEVSDEGIDRTLNPREGPSLAIRIFGIPEGQEESLPDLVIGFLGRAFEFAQEVRFFTYELSERYEEINLLYSISETLGSLLRGH